MAVSSLVGPPKKETTGVLGAMARGAMARAAKDSSDKAMRVWQRVEAASLAASTAKAAAEAAPAAQGLQVQPVRASPRNHASSKAGTPMQGM